MQKKIKQEKLTGERMRQMLWENMVDLKANKMKPLEANSIAKQSQEICRTVATELAYYKACGIKPSKRAKLLG